MRVWGLVVVVLFAFEGCGFLDGGGGGGGGSGGGSGSVTFERGFVYVRKDTRNLTIADAKDYQTTASLTTGGGVSMPSLSSDGAKVVFVHATATGGELQVLPVTGGTPGTVLRASAQQKNFRTPVFSPDAGQIAFAYDEGTSSAIGMVNPDGSGFVKLAGGGSFAYGSPSWAADGRSVLAAAGTPGLSFTQIEQVSVTTGTPTPVTNTLGNEAMGIASRLVLSPDGTKAVFDATVSSGVTRVFLINLSTKVVTKLNEYPSEPTANDSGPCWVSASTVAYSSDSGGNDNVYTVSVSGTGRDLLLPKAIEAWYGPIP